MCKFFFRLLYCFLRIGIWTTITLWETFVKHTAKNSTNCLRSLYIKISIHIYWNVYLVNKNFVTWRIIFLPVWIGELVLFSIGIWAFCWISSVGFEFRFGNCKKNKYFLLLVYRIVTSLLKIDILERQQVPRISHMRRSLAL